MRRIRLLSVAIALLWSLAAPARAERLPATIYTTADGLASNHVYKILSDSRGFIWFATREGLSRFDGYAFLTYGVDDGLPSAVINDIIETRSGVYLVATTKGLARLETAPRTAAASSGMARAAMFSVHEVSSDPASRSVAAVYESSHGIWVATRAGLFRTGDVRGDIRFRKVDVGPHAQGALLNEVRGDRFQTLWVASSTGLRRVWTDGRVDVHLPAVGFHSVLEDRAGHIWAGTRLSGLVELTLDPRTGQVQTTRVHSTRTGLPHDWINQLLESKDGEIWAASTAGLIQLVRTSDGNPRIRLFGETQGLGRGEFQSMALDRNGNLWAATSHSGAIKIAGSGFSTFDRADGIRSGASLIQTRAGDLCFIGSDYDWALWCFNGVSFDPIRPHLRAETLSWGWDQIVLEDHAGEWWMATRDGVARLGKAARLQDLQGRLPTAWYGTAQGIAASVILRLLEDSRGDIWIAAVGEGRRNGLSRWQRTTNTLVHYDNAPNLPDLKVYFPTAFAEDLAGNVWIGFSGDGGIARYRNGAFDRPEAHGLVTSVVRTIVRDTKGRLWVGTYDGLVRVDRPADEVPTFSGLSTKDGLSSNFITAIAPDPAGFLYVGNGRGIDRFEPESGRVRHYSARDGYITPGEIVSALLDRRTGHVWFGQQSGVSRLIPPPDPSPLPPPILITDVEVAGQAEPLNPLGETTLGDLRIEPSRNNLRVEYVALGFGPGEDLRYQYRLQRTGSTWSPPSTQRAVNFASLAPGAYRFEVRAIGVDGATSVHPATIAFTVLRPMWQRWWFVALASAAAASLLYAAYRYRLKRALDMAAVRARIASDLHDDIGANLTKIAVLSEVARQRLDSQPEADDRLSAIARISRESVASMSDVVWAINPRRDNLRDTIRRMRQHAEEVFSGTGVDLRFRAPDAERPYRVPIDVRRDFFLIFKEALNNVVRHSGSSIVTIEVGANGSQLGFRVIDNGVGFQTSVDPEGNGLASMRRRAAGMHAVLEITSSPGQGTMVQLSVPGSYAGGLRWPA